MGSDGSAVADKCITTTYLYVCDKFCGKNCSFQDEAFSKLSAIRVIDIFSRVKGLARVLLTTCI